MKTTQHAPWSCRGTQLFGTWAIESDRFGKMVDLVRGMRLEDVQSAHAASVPQRQAPSYAMRGSVAIIDLSGPLTKYSSSFQAMFGGSSTMEARRSLRKAQADEAVTAIALRIDSPGGTVDGIADLVDEIGAVSASKPVWAFVEDLGASAAYWVACACDRIVANRTAMVGSIGVFSVLEDSSAQAELVGIKVHVVRTGPLKGAGVAGTPITPETLADSQRVVDAVFASFAGDVGKSRELAGERLDAVSTGQVWIAKEAKRLGLVDAIDTFDSTITKLGRARPRRVAGSASAAATRKPPMHQEDDFAPAALAAAPVAARPSAAAEPAATIAQLRAEFPDAGSDFYCDCAETGLTLSQATKAYGRLLAKQNAALREDLAAERRRADEAAAAPPRRSGAAPVAEPRAADPVGHSAREQVDAIVAERVARGAKRHEAHSAVMRERPDLRRALVDESQPVASSRR